MRKTAITMALSALLIMALAVPALAAVTFDPETGTGFIGKGDVQTALGWNNTQLQDNVQDVTFSYQEVGEYEVVCTGHSNPSQNPRTFRNRELSVEANVMYEARKNSQGQITGFTLTEFGEETASGEGCPKAWPTEVSRTPNSDAGQVVGLFVHFDDVSDQLTWP